MRRIQRKREKGWRKPEGAINIARPSVYGNPFDWRVWGRFMAAVGYWNWMLKDPAGQQVLERARRELAGHDVMCWCPLDEPCHGDVLIELLEPKFQLLEYRFAAKEVRRILGDDAIRQELRIRG